MLLTPAPLGHCGDPISIFNGKDLTGWTGAEYKVQDGVLICSGNTLRTEKEYSNYVFEFDFLLPQGGNNGIGIHYPGEGRPSGAGMELQILDNSHPKYAKLKETQYHGSLYKLVVQTFQQTGYTVWYVVAMLVLGFHLWHAFHSAFQTLSLRSKIIRNIGSVLCIFIATGFVLLPIAAYTGFIK